MELDEIFEIQRNFDGRMGWNEYDNCRTSDEIVDFMEHFVLVVVDELGEISRVRKKFLRESRVWTFLR